MVQVTESDYRTAQDGNAKVRQEFLDAIDLEDLRIFSPEVFYDFTKRNNTRKKFRDGEPGLMACLSTYSPASMISFGKLVVYPEAFHFFSYGEFLSGFLDHEGQHLRQLKENPSGWNWNVDNKSKTLKSPNRNIYFTELFEIPAIANQLARRTKRNLTIEEKNNLIEQFALSELSLTYSKKYFILPRNLKEDLRKILCNSDGDNLVRQHFGIN